MKKILSAYIQQVIQFDTYEEYSDYIKDLKNKHQNYAEKKVEIVKNNAVRLTIRKQYNNNKFPG